MGKSFQRALWWIKRDIRLDDNEALQSACSCAAEVMPVYVVEPMLWTSADASAMHLNAVRTALSALRDKLRADYDADLLVIRGDLPEAFDKLRAALPFDAIFAEEETGLAHTFERDKRVRAWARKAGLTFRELPHAGVIRGLGSREDRKRIWNARMAYPAIDPPRSIPQAAHALRHARSSELPGFPECGFSAEAGRTDLAQSASNDAGDVPRVDATASGRLPRVDEAPSPGRGLQRVDEPSARRVLESFLSTRGEAYNRGISSPEIARWSGSRLSAHLAWGTISLRRALQRIRDYREEARATRKNISLKALSSVERRLHWHDHFCQRLEDEPQMEFEALNPAFRDLEYSNREELFEAWFDGRTGMPMVDACMRCLRTTGFLNFRMRAMLVSSACHLFDLSWKRIRYPMAQIMGDYLPGIHISQLQMQAGVVGINTIRVYSPAKQLTDHDEECTFVRKWIPELAGFPAGEIVAHAKGEREGPLGDYPAPLVDYKVEAKRARSMLYSLKNRASRSGASREVLDRHGSRLPASRRRG
ncbi:MAG: deoxyribodipyrimidine photo-lyase/cryptochrome family protein [Spirochaetales bacterium]